MDFLLTERFCQDPAEEYFGKQRKLGRPNDNPDIHPFGYNGNTIRIQRTVSCQSGNTRGRKDKQKAWENMTDAKLPSRKETTLNSIIQCKYFMQKYMIIRALCSCLSTNP